MNKGCKPYAKEAGMLHRGMEHTKSLLYRVTARWLFYRLLQDGFYHDKKDYHNKFLPLTADARKRFYKYKGWRPWALADDTRELIPGHVFDNPIEWFEVIMKQLKFKKTKWVTLGHYIEVWFEARAMREQFHHYAEEIPLLPFGGDFTIEPK